MERVKPLVCVGDWAVSSISGSGIAGVLLTVYKRGYGFTFEYAIKNMPFATREEADAYALAAGYLKEYEPRDK